MYGQVMARVVAKCTSGLVTAEVAILRPLFAAIVLLFLPALPALAQDAYQPPVAVLDFNDMSAYSGHLLGRRAADSVFLALKDGGGWTLIERRTVRQECHKLELEPPFAVGHLQQVAHLVGAHLAVSGLVKSCTVTAARASVVLVVEVVDLPSGEIASRASCEGSAPAKPDQPIDLMVDRALAAAAANGAQRLGDFPRVMAAVALGAGGDALTLNAGSQTGVTAGLKLLVYHAGDGGKPTGEPIATIRVASAQAAQSQCRVLASREAPGTGDIAVAVGRG